MQDECEEMIRPFARIMADEVSSDEAELWAKKGLFNSVRSGHNVNDWPDNG